MNQSNQSICEIMQSIHRVIKHYAEYTRADLTHKIGQPHSHSSSSKGSCSRTSGGSSNTKQQERQHLPKVVKQSNPPPPSPNPNYNSRSTTAARRSSTRNKTGANKNIQPRHYTRLRIHISPQTRRRGAPTRLGRSTTGTSAGSRTGSRRAVPTSR